MRQRLTATLILGAVLPLASGCTDNVSLSYRPSVPIRVNGPAVVASVDATDDRSGQDDAYRLGVVRGGFGNPLKILEGTGPAADIVADVVQRALVERGEFGGPNAPVSLEISVERLSAEQYLGREARTDITLTFRRRSDDRIIFVSRGQDELLSGNPLSFGVGVFGSTERLRLLLQESLDRAVDLALDDPGLRAALVAAAHPNRAIRAGASGAPSGGI